MQQDRQDRYKAITETRSSNDCCRGKAESIICFACVSIALVMQHAKCMNRIISSSVA